MGVQGLQKLYNQEGGGLQGRIMEDSQLDIVIHSNLFIQMSQLMVQSVPSRNVLSQDKYNNHLILANTVHYSSLFSFLHYLFV